MHTFHFFSHTTFFPPSFGVIHSFYFFRQIKWIKISILFTTRILGLRQKKHKIKARNKLNQFFLRKSSNGTQTIFLGKNAHIFIVFYSFRSCLFIRHILRVCRIFLRVCRIFLRVGRIFLRVGRFIEKVFHSIFLGRLNE